MFRSAKWRLIAKTIPIMIVIVLAKLVVNAVHADVLTLSPLFSGIVAANFFLLGFLLAGTHGFQGKRASHRRARVEPRVDCRRVQPSSQE